MRYEEFEELSDTMPNLRVPRRRVFSRRNIAVVVFLGLGVTFSAGLFWLHEIGVFDLDESRLKAITTWKTPDNTIVFDRSGAKIAEFFREYHIYVPFANIPKNLVNAVVAIEDAGFWKHRGIDAKAMTRAALQMVRKRRITQGGSTITQQLVRHVFLSRERTIERKLREIALALRVERVVAKERVLELYLNTLFLGQGSYGIGAAAHRYFGKELAQLTLSEAAMIAGLFQRPSRTNPSVDLPGSIKRRDQVLAAMERQRFISRAEHAAARAEKVRLSAYKSINDAIAPHFVDFVRQQLDELLDKSATREVEGAGLRIYTTLDLRLQRAAQEAIHRAGPTLERIESGLVQPATTVPVGQNSGMLEAALLSTNPATGEILAMVGGRDYDRSQFNRATTSLQSPGSAFKPAVYSLALARGSRWSDVVIVAPISLDGYRPRSGTTEYFSETTLLRAFYRSFNSPALELGKKLGLDALVAHATRLGVRSPLKREFGTILGSSEVTAVDLARMYGTFASGGMLAELFAVERIESRDGKALYRREAQAPSRVLAPEVSYLMTEGMRTVLRLGTGAAQSELAEYAAGKTGTSNNGTDNWFCGYTNRATAIVWVGTDSNDPLPDDATGSTLALPIWATYMRSANRLLPPSAPSKPEAIVTAAVDPKSGAIHDGGVRMYFVRGYEPQQRRFPQEAEGALRRYRSVFD